MEATWEHTNPAQSCAILRVESCMFRDDQGGVVWAFALLGFTYQSDNDPLIYMDRFCPPIAPDLEITLRVWNTSLEILAFAQSFWSDWRYAMLEYIIGKGTYPPHISASLVHIRIVDSNITSH